MVNTIGNIMTKEEYIAFEWQSERRHEFINGQLFEMPGEQDINNAIALGIAFFLMQSLSQKKFSVFAHDVKVAIPHEDKYYYPDVFVTNEPRTNENKYIKTAPVLIAEVVSPSSRIYDTVDKYLDYIKIPSLNYYLVVEPEIMHIMLYHRNSEGLWQADIFTQKDQLIYLPSLGIQISVSDIYRTTGI